MTQLSSTGVLCLPYMVVGYVNMDRQKVSRSLNSCFSLFTLTFLLNKLFLFYLVSNKSCMGWWGRPGNWSFHLCSWPSQVTVSKVLPVPGRSQLATRGTTEKLIKHYQLTHTSWWETVWWLKSNFFWLISKLVRIKEIVRSELEYNM